MSRKIATRGIKIDDQKRLVNAIAESNYPSIGRLISTAVKQKLGISAITVRIKQAVSKLYSPKNYSEAERHLAILLWRFGGSRVCNIASRALNLPSVSTARRALAVPTIEVSAQFPIRATVKKNIAAVFPPDEVKDKRLWINVETDELKLDERPRFDELQNAIVGMCREHIGNFETQFRSIEDLQALVDGKNNGEVHIGSEVGRSDHF